VDAFADRAVVALAEELGEEDVVGEDGCVSPGDRAERVVEDVVVRNVVRKNVAMRNVAMVVMNAVVSFIVVVVVIFLFVDHRRDIAANAALAAVAAMDAGIDVVTVTAAAVTRAADRHGLGEGRLFFLESGCFAGSVVLESELHYGSVQIHFLFVSRRSMAMMIHVHGIIIQQ